MARATTGKRRTRTAKTGRRARAGGTGRATRATGTPRRTVANAEVARLFREVADLLEIEGANPFRIRAYRTAARTVEELPESVHDLLERGGEERLDELPGIGADLAGKIAEIVRTGTLSMLEGLEKEVPPAAAELMRIPGLGPKRTRVLVEELGISSPEELARAARERRVRELPGFGAKTEEKILHELELAEPGERRVLRATAAQYGESLLEWLGSHEAVTRAEIAGSYRRCRETVGDLDILVTCADSGPAIEHFVAYPDVAEVLARGPTKASVRLRAKLQVDVRVLEDESFGAGLHYFTGSKAHNIAIRRLGHKKKLKINEYGVFRGKKRVGGRTEEEVFESVALPWIPPELREDRGEIEAAAEGRLPRLVELGDIRGDLQCHTTGSDGRDTLDAMAEAAQERGYEYLAITDHTPALRMVKGLGAKGLRRQMKRIDALNDRLEGLTVLRSAEVDIHPDGSLDLEDDVLEELDLAVVSIHSKFDLPREEQTARVLAALEHPAIDVLAHPFGRLIGKRRPIALDLEAILDAAVERGVLLEVNAQPERLDLDDSACRAAVERGVGLVISTDAHSAAELGFMRWGVEQARRGWAERADVANALPLGRLRKRFRRARRG